MTSPTAAGTTGLVPAGDWVADPAACTVTFAVRNFRLRTVTGQVPLTSASVIVGPSGQPVSVRAELDARGIDTGNRRRDSDLRGPRFLATDRWPAITFEASDVQASGAGWTINGTLTIKDRYCPVRLDVSGPDIRPGDPAAPVGLRATGRLDRRAAGVDAAPAFLVGHIISLSLAVRLCPPATIPGASLRRAPATAASGKEGRI
jgi:polyisoprenoid-binding protein YceI